MRRRAYASGLAGLALIMTAATGRTDPLQKRAEVVQQGDFVIIGNTLAQDCSLVTPAPVVGTLDCAGAGNTNDLPPDVFWRAEAGSALANATIPVDQAQSAAALKLPPGAEVTHAYLYWAAYKFGMSDNAASLQCMDQGGEPIGVQAISNQLGQTGAYNSIADVTEIVKTHGACTYLVSGVDSVPLSGAASQVFGYALWWMAVLYKAPSAPHRHLVLFDGLDLVGNGGISELQPSGFLVPKNFNLFSKAKIGVIGYDGDASISNDQLFLGDVALEDEAGNALNFFNSTRSSLGAVLPAPGDLPELSGAAGSMNRLDLDTIDITPFLTAGQTQIDVKASSVGDFIELAGFVASIPTFTDEDEDTLSDDEEVAFGTDPKDADTDDDGVPDGAEGCSDLANCPDPAWFADTDLDGLINALDPDSDNDGLLDGTELGLGCTGMGTEKSRGRCVEDADDKTKTDPLNADTDGGGMRDGSEDANLNGLLDEGETDPTLQGIADDISVVDTDADGLSDALEATLGSSPNDADTDDDGLLDGLEANPSVDMDGDALSSVRDVDSDNDALFDGTEAGKDCLDPATKKELGHCVPDADPMTTTSPVSRDSDRGGAIDGSEDWNLDGALSPGETDATAGHADDDATLKDTDEDGFSDELETKLGSKVDDKDTDDDGVRDGAEANPSDDTDADGAVNVLDPDSDGDGLFDGTERGGGCADEATERTANHCVRDADTGQTTTCAIDADTDRGGVDDGTEDFNKDGAYDSETGEGDPNKKADDVSIQPCVADANCGLPDDGLVCAPSGHCIEGCRDVEGSRCPSAQICSSENDVIGYCIDTGPANGSGGAGGASSGGTGGGVDETSGCTCEVQPSKGERDLAWLAVACVGALSTWRRRQGRARRARDERTS